MHTYQVLRRPVLTEKSNYQAEILNTYTFEVDRKANKIEVAKAVEEIFEVTVLNVNVINVRGKSRRFGRHYSKSPDWKKAVVTLQAGDSISFFEGV